MLCEIVEKGSRMRVSGAVDVSKHLDGTMVLSTPRHDEDPTPNTVATVTLAFDEVRNLAINANPFSPEEEIARVITRMALLDSKVVPLFIGFTAGVALANVGLDKRILDALIDARSML